jgi:hypothetical protein
MDVFASKVCALCRLRNEQEAARLHERRRQGVKAKRGESVGQEDAEARAVEALLTGVSLDTDETEDEDDAEESEDTKHLSSDDDDGGGGRDKKGTSAAGCVGGAAAAAVRALLGLGGNGTGSLSVVTGTPAPYPNDLIPDVILGRVPVRDSAEAYAYVDKVRTFENTPIRRTTSIIDDNWNSDEPDYFTFDCY